jgi:sugar lactone lactonase YvrE
MRPSGVLTAVAFVSIGGIALLGQGQPRDPVRTPGVQSGQDPDRAAFLAANCKTPPPAPAAGRGGRGGGGAAAPQPTQEYTITDIPGVVAAGERWKLLWEEPGNNADGIVTVDDEGVLVARNDKSDVLKVDRAGRTSVAYTDTYTGGALAANAKGQLFIAERSLNSAIWLLAPERRLFANTLNGEPLDCLGGGVLNDVAADNKGGVYFTMGGLYYANPQGVVSGRYGTIGGGGGGLILSPDEKTLYATGRPGVAGGGGMVAFDIQRDGSLTNERVFADVGNDGTTVDAAGRIYTVRQDGIVVFSPEGKVLGVIGAPRLFVSLAFGGPDKRTLFAAAIRDVQVMSIPTIAQGYKGRPK